MSAPEQVVVAGASLAGLRAAEALRDEGFTGTITVIGDEPHAPYDRPPLSKSVLTGWLDASRVPLARTRDTGARWLLGTAATGLDRAARQVTLADGRTVPYDRLLIATGVRARNLPGAPGHVRTLRTRDDAARLRDALAAGPERVLIIGGGFTGSEVASACRTLGLDVTLVHRGPYPLSGALGPLAGQHMARRQREAGVDLRLETTVTGFGPDGRAELSDGSTVAADVTLAALGSVPGTEWLREAGLDAGPHGVVCDRHCRVLTADGTPCEDIFAAGDVARWPYPLHDGELISLEHWGNAIDQARAAARNLTRAPDSRQDYAPLPAFWSDQFGANIKVLGIPGLTDQAVLTQGSPGSGRFVIAHGRQGRLTAVTAVNSPRVLDGYASMIRAHAPFPPQINAADAPAELITAGQ